MAISVVEVQYFHNPFEKETTMVRKTRRVIVIPASLAEANHSLFRLGTLERSIAAIENDLAERIAALRKKADAESAPLLAEHADLAAGLELFAQANRETILERDRKSVRISGGAFGWRITPFKVEFLRGGAKKVLAEIKKLKLKQYIRIKESIDKEALLKDRPVITGVKYTQREEFFFEVSSEAPSGPDEPTNVVAFAKTA